MPRPPRCLACKKPMVAKNPRATDRSRKNNLCPSCYLATAVCVCGCGETTHRYSARGNERQFVHPSHYFNIEEKRKVAAEKQSVSMKKAWQRESYREPRCGENNHSWKGGIWLYPTEFNRNLKKAIKQRDGFQCKNPRCPHRKDNRPLHVHHIDGDKCNNDPDNLVTLCDHCHHALHPIKNGLPITIDELP